MFFESNKDAKQRVNFTPSIGEFTDFGENYEVGKKYGRFVDSMYSKEESFTEVLEPIIADIKQKTGIEIHNFGWSRDEYYKGSMQFSDNIDPISGKYINYFQEGLDEINKVYKDHPDIYKDQPLLTREFLQFKAAELAQNTAAEYQDITSRADSIWGSLAAGARHEILDIARTPEIAIPMLIAPFQGSFLRIALREFMIGVGETTYSSAQVAEWRNSVGLEYTWEEFLLEAGTAGAGAALFGVTLKGAINGFRALRNAGVKIPKDIEAEILKAEMDLEDANTNPLKSDNPLDANHEHTTRINESIKRMVGNDAAAEITEKPVSRIIPPKNIDEIMNNTTPDDFQTFRPGDLVVDAKQFQFKEGGDKFGVSKRLQGITKWEAEKSGTLIVYEKLDGSKVVVDGHQRLGLAKRILSQKDGQDPKLIGFVLREADGITADEAMIRAAMKNIAEGTGSPIDAAKVLRMSPERAANLPQASSFVRMAQELSNLNDDAFAMVVNGVIEPRFAALIGRLVQDVDKHSAIIKVLKETNPKNVTEAESIVRQAMNVEFTPTTNMTLFGEETITESLFKERASILDNALKTLRRDKITFSNLVQNQSRIEREGNKLETDINKKRVANDSMAAQIIMSLANRKGDISDALTQAAKRFKEEGNSKGATQDFVDLIRREIQRGNISGDSLGTIRRNIDVEEEGFEVAASPKQLDDFDDPVNGPGVKNQGDSLETQFKEQHEVKEAFQKDIELRQDLKKVIDEGADEATIESHPAVTKAIDEAMAIPLTNLKKGYGTEQYWLNRTYNFNGETVKGTGEALARLFESAKKLAWTDDELIPPSNPAIKNKQVSIILGPAASGKSTIANRIGQKTRSMIIDADEAKKVLPEYKDGVGANAVHKESQAIATALEDVAIRENYNIIIPTVGKDVNKISKLMNKYKKAGYEINLINMNVTPSNALKRMYDRFINTGRLIPPGYMKSIGNKPIMTYNKLKGKADGYAKIDNNQAFGQNPRIEEIKSDLLQEQDFRLREGGERGDSGIPREFTRRDSESISEIPIGQRIDENGELVPDYKSPKQILDDIEQDRVMLSRLEGCV